MSRSANGAVRRNVGVVGVFTMLSRALGLVREVLQAKFIGAEWQQSAFALAFSIPNMARRMFGEGALTAAFVPVFQGELAEGGVERAQRLARAVMSMVVMLLAAVTVLVVIGVSGALAFPESLSPRAALTLRLVRILIPYMVFICAAAFGMGVLNALGRFAAPAAMPCILNIAWIGTLAAISFYPGLTLERRATLVSVAILFAGFLQMAFLLHAMARHGIKPAIVFSGWRDDAARLVWRNTATAVLASGAVQVNYMLDQVLAQCASSWAAGVISYSERLMELPLGVIGTAFGTVLLPTFSSKFQARDEAGARSALLSSVRDMLWIMVPAAAGLCALAPEVTRLVYERGEFGAVATVRVSRALAVYALGLPFFGIQKSLVPWFQAQKDMKTPLAVAVKMVFVNAALNILAVVLLPVEFRHVGLATSTVLCSIAACAMLAREARLKNGAMGWRSISSDVWRFVGGAAVMTAVVAASVPLDSIGPVWGCLSRIALGGAAYFAFTFVCGRLAGKRR